MKTVIGLIAVGLLCGCVGTRITTPSGMSMTRVAVGYNTEVPKITSADISVEGYKGDSQADVLKSVIEALLAAKIAIPK